jgi:hypothetical protein
VASAISIQPYTTQINAHSTFAEIPAAVQIRSYLLRSGVISPLLANIYLHYVFDLYQALDRTQPGLPIKKERCGTMTHDYKRNGTTTLFAALETLEGRVIGQCYQRHRHQEFLRFLRALDQEFPGEVPLHLILDNYGTHEHANVRAWLKRHPVCPRNNWIAISSGLGSSEPCSRAEVSPESGGNERVFPSPTNRQATFSFAATSCDRDPIWAAFCSEASRVLLNG